MIARRAEALLPTRLGARVALAEDLAARSCCRSQPAGATVYRTFYRDSTGWDR